MKTKNKSHVVIMATLVAVIAASTWSCNKDDDPSLTDLREDKLQYLEDSLRISDSLRLTNSAGVVNYAITVVDGSTSSIYASPDEGGSRTTATQAAVDGAVVTISQYGRTQTDTTDESGMVVFTGFFRSSANVTIRKPDFTSVSFIAGVHVQDTTPNGSISFVGNLIPVFPTVGPSTATISGRATIETNLTNRTRETVADGATVLVSIDASPDSEFADRFLTRSLDQFRDDFLASCGCNGSVYVGSILQASYATGAVGTVTGGNYSVAVPAAIDGLPVLIEYSDVAADQTLFETIGAGTDDRTSVYRTLFGPDISPDLIPSGSTVTVSFVTNTVDAAGTAHVSATSGEVDHININDDGSGYTGTPTIQILGNGTGATATATVTNGSISAITVTNPGSGYSGVATVNILDGNNAADADVVTLAQDGTVTSVVITNSGFGYTAAPTVTFTAPTGTLITPVTATGTANISNGRVTGVTITNPGAGYITPPTVTFSAAPAGGQTATADAFYSGQSILDVLVTNPGAEYSYAPAVVFSAPNIAPGVTPTATAIINPTTGQVTGIVITNDGMGYTVPPAVTLVARTSPATAQVFLSGGSVLAVDIDNEGADYASAPAVLFTGGGGQGAAGTAIMADGKVIGVTVTSGGSGYTGAPTVNFVSGSGAAGFVTVVDGAVSGITITDTGHDYTGAPIVIIGSSVGGGATATATVAGGAVTGATIVTGGSGYLDGNTPAGSGLGFSSTKGSDMETKPGLKYINDIYYGTGDRQE